jgi:predicted RNase H-like HicB family nuclease
VKLYHVLVEQDEGWFIGRVLEREGITTQGRSLDELVFMVRDAISLMWDENSVQLELLVPSGAMTSFDRRFKNNGTKSAGRKVSTTANRARRGRKAKVLAKA